MITFLFDNEWLYLTNMDLNSGLASGENPR
jgi:hypothetical protein